MTRNSAYTSLGAVEDLETCN